jgi:hypothetical protein
LSLLEVFGAQGPDANWFRSPVVDNWGAVARSGRRQGFPTETGPVIEPEQGVKAGAMGGTHGFKVQ